jgi:Uma2 family endonuclease
MLPATADDLWQLSATGQRCELVEGRIRLMNPSGAEHGRVSATAGLLLGMHARAGSIGVVYCAETGFVLATDPDTVRGPDAAFVRADRVAAAGRVERFWPGAPDFVVEVVSPGDSSREVREKALCWVEAGVVAALVLHPSRRTATVYRASEVTTFGENDELDLSDAVPGWQIRVSEFFD